MANSVATPTPARESERVRRIQALLGLTRSELADAIDLSVRTLDRRPLTEKELDRLDVLEEIGELARQLLRTDGVPAWFARPKMALEGRAPKDLLGTESGRRVVVAHLERLIDGTVL